MTRRGFLPLLAAAVPPPVTRIVLGGDVMLCRTPGRLARLRNDPALPLRGVSEFLAAADIAVVNLESPFSDQGKPVESGMIFKAEPDMVEALKVAGIDVAITANNHARDRGAYGIEYTLRWLAANGIAAVGTGLTPEAAHAGAVVARNGLRFGFLAYAQDQANGNWPDKDPRVCGMDIPAMRRDLAAMKARADVAVVAMHAGVEYWSKPHQSQVDFAHAAIDAGAAVVMGHHPHVAQPVERYGQGAIFYSLGNLVFDQSTPAATRKGLLAEVTFEGRAVAHVRTIDVAISDGIPSLQLSHP